MGLPRHSGSGPRISPGRSLLTSARTGAPRALAFALGCQDARKAPRRLPRRRRPPRRSRQSKSGAGQGSLRRCSRRVSLVDLIRCAGMDSAESLAGSISYVRPRQPVRSLTQPTPSWGSHFACLQARKGEPPRARRHKNARAEDRSGAGAAAGRLSLCRLSAWNTADASAPCAVRPSSAPRPGHRESRSRPPAEAGAATHRTQSARG